MATRKKIPLIDAAANLDVTGTVSIAGSGSAVITFPATSGTLAKTTDIPVKAIGSEVDTGTDDAKFVTAKAINDSHNVPSVAPSTSGNVMTSNGTDWVSSAPSGGGTTIKTITIKPIYNSASVVSQAIADIVFYSALINIPSDINVNYITIDIVSSTANGTLKLVLYSEDGQTQIFNETTGTISTTGAYTHTMSSTVNVPAGNYYFGVNGVSPFNKVLRYYGTIANSNNIIPTVAKPVLTGTASVSSGTVPTTINPNTTLTSSASCGIIARFDN